MKDDEEPESTEVSLRDRNRIERIVWSGLGVKSARQISEEAGIPPDEVLRIKRELLDSVDVLTIAEKRQKLVVELQKLADDARARSERISDEFFAGTVNASVGAMKTVLTELARMDKADQSKIESLNMLRVRELLLLMKETIEAGVVEIAEAYQIDEDELFEIFNAKLQAAASKRDAGLD